MEEKGVLSITIRDLLEIDNGRGIHFGILKWTDTSLCIRMIIGEHWCNETISLLSIDVARDGFKDYILRKLKFYADELYEKHLKSEIKKREILHEC